MAKKLFRGNQSCVIVKNGGYTAYGQPVAGSRVTERYAIVEFKMIDSKTSVRADTSASRGAAEEAKISATLLFEATTSVALEDLLELQGQTLRVVSRFPRHNIKGELDHFEITAVNWNPT